MVEMLKAEIAGLEQDILSRKSNGDITYMVKLSRLVALKQLLKYYMEV